MRSSKPSKRAERSVSAGSAASSSTTACVSGRPFGVSAITGPGRSAVDGFERGRDDVHPQHHPRPTAVRLVVDLARAQRRRVAVVEEPQLELPAEDARDRPLLCQPRIGVRDEGEDVDAHGLGYSGSANPVGDDDPPAGQIHLPDARLDEGQRRAGVELEHVVGRVLEHLAHPPELPSALLLDVEPDELEDVELVLVPERGSVARATASSAPRSTGRSSRITGRPPEPRREATTDAGSPPA